MLAAREENADCREDLLALTSSYDFLAAQYLAKAKGVRMRTDGDGRAPASSAKSGPDL